MRAATESWLKYTTDTHTHTHTHTLIQTSWRALARGTRRSRSSFMVSFLILFICRKMTNHNQRALNPRSNPRRKPGLKSGPRHPPGHSLSLSRKNYKVLSKTRLHNRSVWSWKSISQRDQVENGYWMRSWCRHLSLYWELSRKWELLQMLPKMLLPLVWLRMWASFWMGQEHHLDKIMLTLRRVFAGPVLIFTM